MKVPRRIRNFSNYKIFQIFIEKWECFLESFTFTKLSSSIRLLVTILPVGDKVKEDKLLVLKRTPNLGPNHGLFPDVWEFRTYFILVLFLPLSIRYSHPSSCPRTPDPVRGTRGPVEQSLRFFSLPSSSSFPVIPVTIFYCPFCDLSMSSSSNLLLPILRRKVSKH